MNKHNKWHGVRIGKTYKICCGHHLPNVPNGHKCKRPHGHNYKIDLEMRGEVNPTTGFLVDFEFFDTNYKPLIMSLDHQYLNEIIDNPTAENLAQWIMDNHSPHALFSVTVWETDNCYAKVVNQDGFWRTKELIE